jgi:hypothetical protein
MYGTSICVAPGPSDMMVDAATMRVATQAVKSVQGILGSDSSSSSSSSSSSAQLLAGGFAVVTVLLADAPHQLRAAASLTPGAWVRLQHFSRSRHHRAAAAPAPSPAPAAASSSVHNLIGEKSAINVLPPFCR